MRFSLFVAIGLALSLNSAAQMASVRGTIAVSQRGKAVQNRSGAVVWLTPLNRSAQPATQTSTYRLTQKNKHFEPHLLVIPQGAQVEFPNKDPFFHNVFSLHEGVRFDLGLYESGTSKIVRFSKPGASYIFCNIHPEMSAVVMVMSSPYYATTDVSGAYNIANVPAGDYELSVWYERAIDPQLKGLRRKVSIGDQSVSVDPIRIEQTGGLAEHHKNKFGMDYEAQPGYKTP